MDLPTRLRRHMARGARVAAFYFLAGVAVSVLVAFILSATVDVRLATPLSAGDEQWSVDRWDRPGATQVLSIRHFWSKWGPRQATGPPDTPTPGDCVTAWASAFPDVAGDWLELSYPNAVVPRWLKIYESYNPGAVCRVTAFKADGTEIEAWKGTDPTPTSAASGTSDIPLSVRFATDRVRIYLASEKVPGWNEIDAAGLVAADGKLQWASDARASSYYGESTAMGAAGTPVPADLVPSWSGLDRPGPAMRDHLANDEFRLADARGWPMLAMHGEKALSASMATAIAASGGSSAYIPTNYQIESMSLPSSTMIPMAPSATPAGVAAIPLRPIWSGLAVDALVFGGALLLLRWLLTAPGRAMCELSRLRRGRCITCGYDLGYDFVRGCPECGWRRTAATCAPNQNGDTVRERTPGAPVN
jgi:hypothetical protein